jgi:adenosine/AMP kinase
MMLDHAQKEIFLIVANRIKQKKESLRQVKNYENAGIEGWFKVETIAALRDYVKEVRDKDPDLVLEVHENKMEIELIAATDFNPFHIKFATTKNKTPCLFLADGNEKQKIEELISDKDIDIVSRETFRDNGNKWIIGMIRPSQEYLFHHQE